MTCTVTKSGGVLIAACTRGRPAAGRCKWCSRPLAKLCDYPVKRNGVMGTCDAPMCERCATAVDADTDYCPPHERHQKKLHARGEKP